MVKPCKRCARNIDACGNRNYCTLCAKERLKEREHLNKLRYFKTETYKRNLAKNKDSKRAYMKKWYAEHTETVKARANARYSVIRERVLSYAKTRRKMKPLYYRERNRRRQALLMKLNVEKIDYSLIFDAHPYCWVCGVSLNKEDRKGYHFDHWVPLQPIVGQPAGTHTASNIRVLCKTHNLKKHNKNPEVFLASLRG